MHPYRVQQASSSIRRRTGGFNPRIHTGCDNKESNYIYTRMTFQSTHPYRMRRHDGQKVELCIIVSIHAPIQGATFAYATLILSGIVSIHAPIQGATRTARSSYRRKWFQSTHPYRVRQEQPEVPTDENGFNPRTHTGCDQQEEQVQAQIKVSIHAPIQGATLHLSVVAHHLCVSIHAPIQGATRYATHVLNPLTVSIHAPIQGATCRGQCAARLADVSIHAPIQGATHWC